MKQFNLEEYLKNPSRKVVTRDGREVRIICTDAKVDCYPIIALIKEQDNDIEEIHTFTKNGLWKLSANNGLNDLFFAPEKHEGWINIYKHENLRILDLEVQKTKEEAKKWTNENCIATIKIEWEE